MNEEIEAARELIREFGSVYPVKAAFWLKASDENFRYLYIASDQIDGGNRIQGYGEMHRLLRQMNTPYLDPFRVKLINAETPLARAVTDFIERFPGVVPTRLAGSSLGGVTIDDAYIYPPIQPATVP